ncbi:transmembrane protein 154 [Denticeps clupeoides]|uniref:Transmembrane protein 154 n=1 Tax=Denticeps clupeoides TaxID=299321 RepID=A0AAY4ACH0_9TELE|nr:transmembrane protein 154 [Denticeps clupeoides]XP_028833217.1 transmembrane protein 154 [Denticeps clupeoides]
MFVTAMGDNQHRRGLWEMAPSLILLFLALTASLTKSGLSQEEEAEQSTTGEESPDSLTESITPVLFSDQTSEVPKDPEEDESADVLQSMGSKMKPTQEPTEEPISEGALSPTIIIIPLVLTLILIGLVVGGVLINRKLRQASMDSDPMKHDLHLDDYDPEKVPMPRFEEDVPSVLELEMEDLEKWMVKDGDGLKINSIPK